MKEYSFKKGLGKALLNSIATAGTLVAFAGFSDLQVWDLVEQYIKPLFGSLTVGGVILVVLNYVKVRTA